MFWINVTLGDIPLKLYNVQCTLHTKNLQCPQREPYWKRPGRNYRMSVAHFCIYTPHMHYAHSTLCLFGIAEEERQIPI